MPGAAVDLLARTRALGFPLDARVVSAAIVACGQGGEWQRAVSLTRSVSKEKLTGPVTWCYIAGIQACTLQGQWQAALELLRKMDQSKREESLPTLFPHPAAYVWAVRACAAAGKIDEALQLLRDMSWSTLDTAALAVDVDHLEPILCALLEGGSHMDDGWGKIVRLLGDDSVDRAGDSTTTASRGAARVVPTAEGFAAVAHACAHAGEWERGLEVLRRAEEAGTHVSHDAVAAVMAACTATKPWQGLRHRGEGEEDLGAAVSEAEEAVVMAAAGEDEPMTTTGV